MGQRDDPERLREDLRQTRAEISETIDALQVRLNPDRLKNDAKTAIRGATIGKAEEAWEGAVERVEEVANKANYRARGTGDTIFDTIKRNPLPSALAGLGLGWLFMNRSGSSEKYPEYRSYSGRPYEGRGGFGPEGAREKVEDVAERVSETAGRAREEAGEFMEDMGERAMDTGSSLMDSIRANPIPSALMGLGLGWFLMNRSSSETRGYYGPSSGRSYYGYSTYEDYYPVRGEGRGRMEEVKSTIGETAEKAQETVGDVATKAQETVSQVADTTRERAEVLAEEVQARAGQFTRTTRYQAGRVEDRFQEMVRENPMGMVAAAVAVGAAVGMALPSTQREDEMLGEARDNLVQQARSTTEETVQKVQRVAEEMKSTAEEEARFEGLA